MILCHWIPTITKTSEFMEGWEMEPNDGFRPQEFTGAQLLRLFQSIKTWIGASSFYDYAYRCTWTVVYRTLLSDGASASVTGTYVIDTGGYPGHEGIILSGL